MRDCIAAHPGHFYVQDHDIGREKPHRPHRLVATMRALNIVAFVVQDCGETDNRVAVVVG